MKNVLHIAVLYLGAYCQQGTNLKLHFKHIKHPSSQLILLTAALCKSTAGVYIVK